MVGFLVINYKIVGNDGFWVREWAAQAQANGK
jgi:hypothetical protein